MVNPKAKGVRVGLHGLRDSDLVVGMAWALRSSLGVCPDLALYYVA